MLIGILLLYAVVIGLGETNAGGPFRVIVLSALVYNVSRLRSGEREQRLALLLCAVAIAATVVTALVASRRTVDAVVGVASALLTAAIVGLIVATLRADFLRGARVDVSTVLGALCTYLLFALFFADVHQFFAAFSHDYLNGTSDPPSPSDLLYFSVITLATVGFGDITPASEVARAVTVVEALIGQLYLVSVVAGVVAGWRRA
jgi:F0F1-type ATP synthase assembly protein I